MFASKDLLFSAEKYNVSRSLRFRRSASAQLTRTPSSASNRKTWTWSGWVKRGLLATGQGIFCAVGAATDTGSFYLTFFTDDIIRITGQATVFLATTQVFRDPSAWYHIVLAMDTTNTTNADNRLRLYVNGSEVTNFATRNNLTVNTDYGINQASVAHYLMSYNAAYCDGYLAEVNFIDGQQLTPTSFGFYDNFGIWQPKGYTGAYGTNGFYLNFSDNSAATATTIGKDTSGNGNNWTPNNISVTAGTTYDSMIDVPTNYLDGSTGRGNYCVLNQVNQGSAVTVAGANLNFTTGSTTGGLGVGTFAVSSGKWYWEVTATSTANIFGIVTTATAVSATYVGSTSGGYGYSQNGNKYNNGSGTAYGATYTTNDVIGIALDLDAGTLIFYKNNASQGTAFTGLSGSYYPAVGTNNTGSFTCSINFGQRPFSYTPPSGYLALNTQNLTAPTIPNGAQYMAAVTYTGNGTASTAITASSSNSGNNPLGVTFQPDLVWIKSRSATTNHNLFDTIRTATNYLISNSTAANASNANTLTAFNTTGFTLGTDAGSIGVNVNAATYVAWEWNAGSGSSVSNTSGSITSTVSANTTAGFSVVGYTGTGANATVGHGLGVAPSMVIVKSRVSTVANWPIYHPTVGAGNYVLLNTTAAATAGATVWNSTAPTSTVFSIGTAAGVNTNTDTYIAYCFAAVDGYSAFGSYTGNGSADGPFIYTGFRPRWIMIKNSGSIGSWTIADTSRTTYNAVTARLFPDLTNIEDTSVTIFDVVANGFKLRSTTGNTSANTYIYAAFAENPFKYARAR